MPASTDQVEMSGAAFVPVCVKVHGGSPPRKRWGTLIQSAIAKTVPWPASDRGFAYKATARGGLKRVNALTAISSPAGARSRPAGVSSSVVVGGRPLWFAFRTQLGLRAMSEKCHVWTAPGWQGLSSRLQHWSVRPCVRPVGAVHMTAGHNALRGSGPGQKPAFDDALALVGCPDRRIDRLCITCCSSSQPSHHAGCPARSRLRRKRDGFLVSLALDHHGPDHPRDLVGERDGGDLGRPPCQQSREPWPMFGA